MRSRRPYPNSNGFASVQARVRVAPQPIEPTDRPLDTAERIFAAAPALSVVVRRYRAKPSPLVRDAIRRWRTGRLDLVLAGNFDLLGSSPE